MIETGEFQRTSKISPWKTTCTCARKSFASHPHKVRRNFTKRNRQIHFNLPLDVAVQALQKAHGRRSSQQPGNSPFQPHRMALDCRDCYPKNLRYSNQLISVLDVRRFRQPVGSRPRKGQRELPKKSLHRMSEMRSLFDRTAIRGCESSRVYGRWWTGRKPALRISRPVSTRRCY